ncbi:sugar phosphate isomerase/epimerase [Pseudomonas duriflava]|uniref:Sugar phosphate isomerase/epimerase n=1 Tax=Pseudomonas duriflava TaxID=459528 RepID=A0A562QFJ5_9PSED|nr:TIM barrel protein [Pseudomonas duriflava]TWI55525.1 sugar phosphate isomerase/epimerase [Pseudomonas duriflava]
MKPNVVVTTSAFGADAVRARGQENVLSLIANAGATTVEIRDELFEDIRPELTSLGNSIAVQGLECVYSVPIELWSQGEHQPTLELQPALVRSARLGAYALKISLGHFTPYCDLKALGHQLEASSVRLLIENDQTPHGGRIESLKAFFEAAHQAGLPIGMTFDVGNWHWQNERPDLAAQALGRYVEYVHCKAVRERSGRLHAVAPEEKDLDAWAALFTYFQSGLPRAIEFPLQGDVLRETQRHVINLSRLGLRETHHA